MINVYLDSNILYSDPLMTSNINNLFMEKMKLIKGKIVISEVVIKETENNYRKRIDEINKSMKKYQSECRLMYYNFPKELIDVDLELSNFHKQIEKYQDSNTLEVIPINNNFLPELVNRAINRRKPFKENKSEFRDCLIWLSYAEHAENSDFTNNFFLTKNYSDFSNGKKSGLHQDFLEDTKKIKLHQDVFQFLDNEEDLINSYMSKMIFTGSYSELNKINTSKFDFKLIEKSSWFIEDFVSKFSENNLQDIYDNRVDYLDFMGIDFIKLTTLNSQFIEEQLEVVYYGSAIFKVEIGLHEKIYLDEYIYDIAEWVVKINFLMKKTVCENQEYKPVNNVHKYLIDDEYKSIEILNCDLLDFDKECLIVNDYGHPELEFGFDMMPSSEEYYKYYL